MNEVKNYEGEARAKRVKELALAMHQASTKMKPALPEVRAALEMLYGVSLGMERNIDGDVEFALAGLQVRVNEWKKDFGVDFAIPPETDSPGDNTNDDDGNIMDNSV